jgi:arylsulfatase A-like enzyme
VQPYGQQVPTPNIQLLADQGVLFRQAFSAAPVCSGSRAALLTGQYCHNNGMLGLAHRGWKLRDYGKHWVHPLRDAGYRSVLIGEQHVSVDPHVIGYDDVIDVPSNHAPEVTPRAVEAIETLPEPGFLSVGYFETHRSFQAPTSVRDTLYSLPPAHLPDTPATREDMAAFKASVRSLDQGIGAVLHALHRQPPGWNTRRNRVSHSPLARMGPWSRSGRTRRLATSALPASTCRRHSRLR